MATPKEQKEIFVYADWDIYDSPRLIGTLYYSSAKGKDVYSFDYDSDWLKEEISIDPKLQINLRHSLWLKLNENADSTFCLSYPGGVLIQLYERIRMYTTITEIKPHKN